MEVCNVVKIHELSSFELNINFGVSLIEEETQNHSLLATKLLLKEDYEIVM